MTVLVRMPRSQSRRKVMGAGGLLLLACVVAAGEAGCGEPVGTSASLAPFVWRQLDGTRPVKVVETEGNISLVFNKSVESEFGPFVHERLQVLYDEFKSQKLKSEPGD